MVTFLEYCGRSNEEKRTGCGVMGLGGKPTKEIYSNSKFGVKQPPMPPTPDPEWNKRHVVLDQPAQPNSIELEYKFYECFNALTVKLDWNNPEGDRYSFDLSKPIPLQGPPGHRTIAAEYFFNNDLEYLKTYDPEVTYTTSITKTKAALYEIKGIEDIVPTLLSTIKHEYDKDSEKGIKH
ncbi:hypothetical protein Tco_0018297 [Tanacetum coccineum]